MLNMDLNESLTTHRFAITIIGIGALTLLGALCIWTKAEAGLAGMVLGALGGMLSAALGFGNSHDKATRVAKINAAKEVQIATTTADLQKQLSVDLPRITVVDR